jgi:hypothetical protein
MVHSREVAIEEVIPNISATPNRRMTAGTLKVNCVYSRSSYQALPHPQHTEWSSNAIGGPTSKPPLSSRPARD